MNIMAVPILDVSIFTASLVMIGGYHLYLRMRLRKDHSYTIQSINATARVAWVDNIMSDKSNGVLGVQTLRNSTMAATFLASTAILMSMGALNLIKRSGVDTPLLHSLQTGLLTNGSYENLKLLLLLGAFFSAFFCFSMAVRMYNHVGYLINSTNSKLKFEPSTRYVGELLNRSGTYYSYGMRAYYISVPLIASIFSPYYMLVASIGLIMFLYKIDRAPHDEVGISSELIQQQKPGTDFIKSPFRSRTRSTQRASAAPKENTVSDLNLVVDDKVSGGN
jgi:uncharacterized membrane protein